MTKLTMPEPAAYVRFADNGNIRLWSKSAYEGEEFMKPLYTAEALCDVLEQAAKFCEDNTVWVGGGARGFMESYRNDGGIHQGMDYAGAIRAMKEQIK